jgi:hypothetical protein
VEMGLRLAKVPHKPGGINAALEHLARSHQRPAVGAQVAEAALR